MSGGLEGSAKYLIGKSGKDASKHTHDSLI